MVNFPSNGPPPELHVPPGVSVPGSKGQAAPDSLIAKLQQVAERKRQATELTIELPGWEGMLRARIGVIGLDELERQIGTMNGASEITLSLQMVGQACRALEIRDDTGDWKVLEDELGPVTFDDRLARRLTWPRPDPEFRYDTRSVFAGLFDNNGILIGQFVAKVAAWMGIKREEIASGEALTAPGSRPPESAPPSALTRSPTPAPARSSEPS